MEATLHQKAIDPSNKTPIYHQLFILLRDRILSGEWRTGEAIPPEPELMDAYSVSRITVRQAVELLAKENLIYRKRGRGTFVSMPSNHTDSTRITCFDNDMLQRGFKPSTKLIKVEFAEVSEVTAEKLRIDVGDELAVLHLLRFADGIPISLEDIFLIHKYCPGILNTHDYEKESVLNVLEKEYGIRITHSEQIVSAMIPTKKIGELLQITNTQPLIYIERISYSQLNLPVEMRHIYYRSDRYALQFSLNR